MTVILDILSEVHISDTSLTPQEFDQAHDLTGLMMQEGGQMVSPTPNVQAEIVIGEDIHPATEQFSLAMKAIADLATGCNNSTPSVN